MPKPRAIPELQKLASELVGDSKTPNLFFVTCEGVVVTVSRDLSTAHRHWRQLAAITPRVECALEDRHTGVLADISPESDAPGSRLIKRDDTHLFYPSFTPY